MTDAANDLVAMVRDAPQFDGGPAVATVHPDEVDDYAAGGWRVGSADPQPTGADDGVKTKSSSKTKTGNQP